MKKKSMQKNFTIILASKKPIVSERILKAFRIQEIECKGVFSITKHRKIKIKIYNPQTKQNKLTQAVAGTSRQHQCSSSCVVPGEKANAATVSQHAVSTCCSTQLEKWKQSQCPCRSSSLHQRRWFQAAAAAAAALQSGLHSSEA